MSDITVTPPGQHFFDMNHEHPRDVSITIPCNQTLEFVYYAVVRNWLGQEVVDYEYQMEEGAEGNFQITIPRPPGLLNEWSIRVFGYREQEGRVFDWTANASNFF